MLVVPVMQAVSQGGLGSRGRSDLAAAVESDECTEQEGRRLKVMGQS